MNDQDRVVARLAQPAPGLVRNDGLRDRAAAIQAQWPFEHRQHRRAVANDALDRHVHEVQAGQARDRARGRMVGSDQYLTKPFTKESLLKGLIRYLAIGWTGYIPKSCRNTEIHLPLKYARFLWGWPNRFLQRMAAVNTRVVEVQGDGKFSEGFDRVEDLKRLPPGFKGYIWTNRIDRIGPVDRQ